MKEFTILIVDDARADINALVHVLKPFYKLCVAINGKTALELAKTNKPDLILLDILMSEMSGFEVLVELKHHELTQRIPVIFITGLDSIADEEKGFALGAADYITKPFHNAIVKARVKMQLQMVEYVRTIEQLGLVDVLTNISNRRDFDNRMDIEWSRALREHENLSVLMVDIDKFKDFNDKYGHLLGDTALQYVASSIKRMLLRKTDFVSRWGGEEFIVLLPHTDMDGALIVAERIRAGIANGTVPETNATITVSIGVNTEMPSPQRAINDFISGADMALYTAKNTGRNRVCHQGSVHRGGVSNEEENK